jgi:hypothetical protein
MSQDNNTLGLFATIGLNVMALSYIVTILNSGVSYLNMRHDAAKVCSSYNMSLKTIQKIGGELKIDCEFKKKY